MWGKNRDRLKSHKETEGESNSWSVHRSRGFFFGARMFLHADTKWERERTYCLVKPFLFFFFFFFSVFLNFIIFFSFWLNVEEGVRRRRMKKIAWPLARSAYQGPEEEELMKERDLRIPCKWRAWIIHSNKIMQPARTSNRTKTTLNRRSRTPSFHVFAEFAPISPYSFSSFFFFSLCPSSTNIAWFGYKSETNGNNNVSTKSIVDWRLKFSLYNV